MTHNDSTNKTDIVNARVAGRAEFLAALYGQVDPALWLEIRCIHPETSVSRVLWSPVGSQSRLSAALRQADAMNRAGFGVYFAPCLRREKKAMLRLPIGSTLWWTSTATMIPASARGL
jgi:hypothetical protein